MNIFKFSLLLVFALLIGKSEAENPSLKSCAKKPNEVYIDGGSACQTTCATLNDPCNIQTFAAVKACYCKDGYARNKFGVCVQINSKQCQNLCVIAHLPCGGNPNEENVMGPPCQTTCQDLNKPCLLKAPDRVACRCKPGYARNKLGVCIQINSPQCQNTCEASEGPSAASCARKSNEVYIQGGSPCQTTCGTLNTKCNIFTKAPVNGCYCINGYARDRKGNCIQINSKKCQELCGYNQSSSSTS